MLFIYMEFFIRLKHMKIVAEIFAYKTTYLKKILLAKN